VKEAVVVASAVFASRMYELVIALPRHCAV
jgi:hypothetical protein